MQDNAQPNEPVVTPEPLPVPTENTPAPETRAEPEEKSTEAADASATEKPEDATPKKNPWFQNRINVLTKEKADARREAEAARLEAQRIKEELNKLRTTKPSGESGTGTNTGTVDNETFQTLVEKVAEQKARQALQEKEYADKATQAYNKGRTEYGEQEFRSAADNLNLAGVLDPSNALFVSTVLELDNAHKVLYHLGQNPEEAQSLAALPVARMAVELAKLDTKLGKPPSKAVSSAPAPVTPVNTGRATVAYNLDDPRLPMEEYIKRRTEQRESRRRR